MLYENSKKVLAYKILKDFISLIKANDDELPLDKSLILLQFSIVVLAF